MTRADTKLQHLRNRSRALFGGAQYRLEIGAAIADGDGLVCIKDLAEELGDPPGTGSVNTELKVLERAGLLTRTPRIGGERRVYLVREPSTYWTLCREMRDGTIRRPLATGVQKLKQGGSRGQKHG